MEAKKLSLKKETIARLDKDQQLVVVGGGRSFMGKSCNCITYTEA